MESSSFSPYLPHKSKRRVFPGSSSSYIDLDEVVEIPPIHFQPQESKEKQGFHKKVAEGDIGGDFNGDIMDTDEAVGTKIKGKVPLMNSHGENSSLKLGERGGSSKKSFSQNPFSQYVSDDDDDDFVDIYEDSFTYEEDFTYDDDYTFLQAHFDGMDIPTGVEVHVPSLYDPSQKKNNANMVNSSSAPNQSGVSSRDLGHPPQPVVFTKATKKATHSSSSSVLKAKQTLKELSHYSSERFKKMKNSSALASSKGPISYPSVFNRWGKVDSGFNPSSQGPISHPSSALTSSHGELEYDVSGCVNHSTPYKPHLKNMNNLSGKDKPSFVPYPKHKKAARHVSKKTMKAYLSGWQDSTYANQVLSGPQPFLNQASASALQFNNQLTTSPSLFADQGFTIHSQMKFEYPCPPPFLDHLYTGSPMMNQMVYGSDTFQEFPNTDQYLGVPWAHHPAKSQKSDTAEGSSGAPSTSTLGIEKCLDADDILKKFHLFKQFDTVSDHADHHYSSHVSQFNQPPKRWAKKIQDEWRILEKDLPDLIYVRAYESRMDLLRAVIVGAEGTPYHDGLFFFDIIFPSRYPDVPPLVYYHSGGLRLNPNLYGSGKVCLSLLNTWSGSHTEQWIPGFSTMLQVLVSIQALILNANPYFNEPGYASMSGSVNGERQSQQYNESTFVLSLRTMVYSIRRRPKHFEDFVVGHFLERAQDILLSCKAYIEGAQVGSLARGGVQDVDASNKNCSPHFRNTVASCIPWLVQALSEMGAKDCDKFLPLAEKKVQIQPNPADRATSSSNLYNAADYYDAADYLDYE